MVSVVDRSSPVLARYRLSAELRNLRERSKLTATQVAKITGETVSTVTRRERGEWREPDPDTVRALLSVYRHLTGITERKQDHLIELAVEGSKEGWWDAYRDRYTVFYRDYLGLEHVAVSLRSCDPQLITWFFQTGDYSRAAIEGRYPIVSVVGAAIGRSATDDLLEITRRRQELIKDQNPLHAHAIIDEVALHRSPNGLGARQMHAQVVRLFEMAQLDNVTIQVVPWGCGIYPSFQPFGLLDLGNDVIRHAGYMEGLLGSDLSIEPGKVGWLRDTWNRTEAIALSPDDTLTLLQGLVDQPPAGPPW